MKFNKNFRIKKFKAPIDGFVCFGNMTLDSYNYPFDTVKNLTVHGKLNIKDSHVKKFEGTLKVDEYFDAKNSQLEELPDGAEFGESVDISKTNLRRLPKNIKVGRFLFAADIKLEEEPTNIEAGEDIYLQGSFKIENPKSITCIKLYSSNPIEKKPTIKLTKEQVDQIRFESCVFKNKEEDTYLYEVVDKIPFSIDSDRNTITTKYIIFCNETRKFFQAKLIISSFYCLNPDTEWEEVYQSKKTITEYLPYNK